MSIKSILNKITNYKGFVFKKSQKIENKEGKIVEIEIFIESRKNSKGICPYCGKSCPTYDTARVARRFEFPPLWGIAVFFVYFMRRVSCPDHGVVTERVPWSEDKSELTKEYRHFLGIWAKRLSWTEVARYFNTTFGKVLRSVEYLVNYGLSHRSLDGVETLGIDEIQYKGGHKYLTLVYQLDEGKKRLLYIVRDRTEKSLMRFFSFFDRGTKGENRRSMKIKWVCSDMWKPYLKVSQMFCKNSKNILDRFHIEKHLNESVDKTRRQEVVRLEKEKLEPVLAKSKWLWLHKKRNLSDHQLPRIRELLGYNLSIVRAYLMKEEFDQFWTYTSAYWAKRFLKNWCTRCMRSRIEPMKDFVRMIRSHEQLLLNWFESKRLSSGIVEGFNNKVKLTTRKSYGFGSFKSLELALYHTLGDLPEPEITHRFW